MASTSLGFYFYLSVAYYLLATVLFSSGLILVSCHQSQLKYYGILRIVIILTSLLLF